MSDMRDGEKGWMVCVCVCVCVSVHASMRACVCARAHARVCVIVTAQGATSSEFCAGALIYPPKLNLP